MRKTQALVQVAMALLGGPARHWGYELSKQTGVRSGVLYPMLTRLLRDGLLEDGWEDPATIRDRRPPRRYYMITDKGRQMLGAVVQDARREPRFAPLFIAVPPKKGADRIPAPSCGSTSGSFAPGLVWPVAISPGGRLA